LGSVADLEMYVYFKSGSSWNDMVHNMKYRSH
jgi:hypothetical protein